MKVKMRKVKEGFEVTTHSDDSRDKRAYCTVMCDADTAPKVKEWVQLNLAAVLAESAVAYTEAVGVQRYIGNGGG